MLTHRGKVIDGEEDFLIVVQASQVLSLGSKVKDFLDLPFKIYEE